MKGRHKERKWNKYRQRGRSIEKRGREEDQKYKRKIKKNTQVWVGSGGNSGEKGKTK